MTDWPEKYGEVWRWSGREALMLLHPGTDPRVCTSEHLGAEVWTCISLDDNRFICASFRKNVDGWEHLL